MHRSCLFFTILATSFVAQLQAIGLKSPHSAFVLNRIPDLFQNDRCVSNLCRIQAAIKKSALRPGNLGIQNTRCQIKFADAVGELLKRKFDGNKVGRVIDSWYRMDQDYIHRERIDEFDTWQEANSYIAGLDVKAFHDPYEFSWARSLRNNAKIIQDEFRRVAVLGADELEMKGNNVWATAANATSASSYGPDWKTLALMDRCVWDDINTKLFPETTRLLRELQVPYLSSTWRVHSDSLGSFIFQLNPP